MIPPNIDEENKELSPLSSQQQGNKGSMPNVVLDVGCNGNNKSAITPIPNNPYFMKIEYNSTNPLQIAMININGIQLQLLFSPTALNTPLGLKKISLHA